MRCCDSSAVHVLDFHILEEAVYYSLAEDGDCHSPVEEAADYRSLDHLERDCRNQEGEDHHIHGHLAGEGRRIQSLEEADHHHSHDYLVEEGRRRNHDPLEEEDRRSHLGLEVLQYL